MNSQRIELLFLGDLKSSDDKIFEGLFSMAGTTSDKHGFLSLIPSMIKRSSVEALKIIHKMLLEKKYSYHSAVQDEFRAFESEIFMQINLGKHWSESKDKFALEIIQFLASARSRVPLSTYIR
jgi:hypothetical protein